MKNENQVNQEKHSQNIEDQHDSVNLDSAPVIHVYTRAEAIEDGVLTDISGLAREAGFKYPVAITCGVQSLLNDTNKSGQSFEGRAWDMLTILRVAIRRGNDAETIHFSPLFSTRYHSAPQSHQLWAKCGPGDDGEPVITIMLTDED